ncbi:MAG: hypothetical protein ABI415_01475 [Flavitalea sp.]
MVRTILFILLIFPLAVSSQTNFLILKKRGKQLRLYVTGSEISLRTVYGTSYDGYITQMQHDSVFVNGIPFHYKEIASFSNLGTRSGFLTVGTGMLAAAGGIIGLGAINGIYRKDKAKDYYSKSGLITAAALAVGGYVMRKAYFINYKVGKKYSVQYLEINRNK